MSTSPDNIPVKTPDGVAELSQRVRRLGQRHRTMLLLIDGRRSEAQVRQMAVLAGAPEALFDELVWLRLVERGAASVPTPSLPLAPPGVAADPVPAPATQALDLDLDLDAEPPAPSGFEADSASLPLTPSLSLLADPNSRFDTLSGELTTLSGMGSPGELSGLLREARSILLRALRSEAPVSGSLTMLRVRRARSRQDIEDLLEEVETRITKSGKELWAAQTLDQARDLLRSHALQSMPMPFA